jgi:hypothetical protein
MAPPEKADRIPKALSIDSPILLRYAVLIPGIGTWKPTR